MKKKTLYACFLILVMVLCAAPSLGMLIFGESQPAANEMLADRPSIKNPDGTFNTSLNDDITNYIADRSAFRQNFITGYAAIKAAVFHESASDDVILGGEGWLFYKKTLNDYLHKDTMTQRQIYGASHTLKMMQDYAESQGTQFVFTIAPNKNSLYGAFMPQKWSISHAENNQEMLTAAMEKEGVTYADLYTPFEQEDEILYYAYDSHWDKRGAALAHDTIIKLFPGTCKEYKSLTDDSKIGHKGDLYEMLYPAGNKLEFDYEYNGFTFSYDEYDDSYTDDGKTNLDTVPVDSIKISTTNEKPDFKPDNTSLSQQSEADTISKTENDSASAGNLLMFRDSFGNNLYPYMAQSFSHATFSRLMPYRMDWITELSADYMVVEIVERNLANLSVKAPVMPAPAVSLNDSILASAVICTPDASFGNADTLLEIQMQESQDLQGYTVVSGLYDGGAIAENTRVYIQMKDGNIYEACPVGEASLFSVQTENVKNQGVFTAYISGAFGETDIAEIIFSTEDAL